MERIGLAIGPQAFRQESSMKVEIRRIEGLRDLKAFVRFPYSIYKGDPCWVPPLDTDDLTTLRKDRNPAFEYCEAEYWMAYSDGRAVGRIAGIMNNRVIEKWGKRYARFGWIDFIEDFDVASALSVGIFTLKIFCVGIENIFIIHRFIGE